MLSRLIIGRTRFRIMVNVVFSQELGTMDTVFLVQTKSHWLVQKYISSRAQGRSVKTCLYVIDKILSSETRFLQIPALLNALCQSTAIPSTTFNQLKVYSAATIRERYFTRVVQSAQFKGFLLTDFIQRDCGYLI